MDTFYETLGVITPLVGAVVFLALFFKILMAWGRQKEGHPGSIALKGILDRQTLATVHLSGGRSHERVRLVGFTRSDSFKGEFPYELNNMLILEHEDGRRTMIQARSIRSIEIDPPAASS